jgi:molybdopterin converting factor small subunit
MRVTLRLGGSLAGTGSREREVSLDPGATIGSLLDALRLDIPRRPQESHGMPGALPGALTILKNGRNIEFMEGTATLLAEGDVVAIFHASEGG